jgi:dTDP-4-dehydrorhamnose reductase
LSHYGKTKAEAERLVLEFPRTLVVRLPLMYGFPKIPRQTTFEQQVAALAARTPLRLFSDEYRTPVALRDAARALLALAGSEMTGIIHVAGPERLSRFEMGQRFAAALGIEDPNLVSVSRLSIDAAEARPADLSLDGSRFNECFPRLAPGPISDRAIGEPPMDP